MYQYDPSMTDAFNRRMQSMQAQGNGNQIAGAYAQAANNGFAPPQQAAPQYQGVQMAPAFRPPPGPQMPPRAPFNPSGGPIGVGAQNRLNRLNAEGGSYQAQPYQQRPNPLMGGGDPRAQTMGYMLRGQQPPVAQGFQRPAMGYVPRQIQGSPLTGQLMQAQEQARQQPSAVAPSGPAPQAQQYQLSRGY